MELLHGTGGDTGRGGAKAKPPAPCPSALDVARFDAGELTDLRRAAVKAHVRRCCRCEGSLAEVRRARKEILGATGTTQSTFARSAAEEIQRLVRDRGVPPGTAALARA